MPEFIPTAELEPLAFDVPEEFDPEADAPKDEAAARAAAAFNSLCCNSEAGTKGFESNADIEELLLFVLLEEEELEEEALLACCS